MSEYSYGFETRVSEYGLSASLAVSEALCLEWPSMINSPVTYRPRKVPRNGNMNFKKWIFAAASIWYPIQKAPPMQPGMMMNSDSGNLMRNSHKLVLTPITLFNMFPAPRSALRRPL